MHNPRTSRFSFTQPLIQSNHRSWYQLLESSPHINNNVYANLLTWKRQLNLPRWTCKITNNISDHNEVQPKPIFPEHWLWALLHNSSNTCCFWVLATCHHPPMNLTLCRHGYNNSPPPIFMRRRCYKVQLQLCFIMPNTTRSPSVTKLVHNIRDLSNIAKQSLMCNDQK
jgi:hypothetical protein